MATLLTMPSLSPTMETGVITAWMKKVGEFIGVGEVLAEIETDKAVMEFEMPDEGYLRALLVEPGSEVAVGAPIAILAESMEEDISAEEAQAKTGAKPAAAPAAAPPGAGAEAKPGNGGTAAPSASAPPPAAAAAPPAAAPPAAGASAGSGTATGPAQPPPTPPQPAAQPSGNGAGERIRISPYARKLARERHIDPAALQGSGPGGRIVARDVEGAPAGTPEAGKRLAAGPAVPVPTHEAGGPAYEDLPLSMMRKAIARKMTESKQTVPHFQTTRKVRMEKFMALRSSLKEQFPDVKISVNDMLVKACAVALRRHPAINSQFLGDRIRRFAGADIAVAVNTEDGLITPVLRNVEAKGLQQIAAETRALAEKARERKLTPEDYTGGTFTISNMGMFGIYEFNAIINTPQACILAVAGVVREPVVEGERIAIGQTMHITLSSDHRVVDGVAAAEFLATLSEIIENPLSLLL